MNRRKIETLVPSFSSDKMVIIPSDFFIICLVIYSPSPKPCCSVLSRLNCTVPSINFSSFLNPTQNQIYQSDSNLRYKQFLQ
jgi:hypothetical protein